MTSPLRYRLATTLAIRLRMVSRMVSYDIDVLCMHTSLSMHVDLVTLVHSLQLRTDAVHVKFAGARAFGNAC